MFVFALTAVSSQWVEHYKIDKSFQTILNLSPIHPKGFLPVLIIFFLVELKLKKKLQTGLVETGNIIETQ